MDLYSSIFTRKSTRSFNAKPLSTDTLRNIEDFIAGLKPLLPGSKITHEIVPFDQVQGIALPKAPHYLLISGKDQPLRNTCAGFLFQQAELYLYAMGYAARWIASAKAKHKNPENIIGIAFGKPAGAAARTLAEFNRKPLSEISEGTDSRLEAVRLAPSGMNGQPWYFAADGNAIHVFCKKNAGGIAGTLYHLTDLDVGISLAHLAVASEHEGRPFHFTTEGKSPSGAPKGFVYIGTVES